MCALKESLDNTVLYGGMNWFGLCDTLQDGVRTRVDDTSLKHSEYLATFQREDRAATIAIGGGQVELIALHLGRWKAGERNDRAYPAGRK